ncbi:uncharacterized protein [Nicotiana tomentosiformis]|uniref:uncharacterized protein n=1 Tax=Nicotiana tomentosiformis TaxID=4098 RepID=UPI00388C7B8E
MQELPRNEPHSQEVQVSSPKKNPNPNPISKPNPNPNDTVAAKPISGDPIDPGDKIKDNQPHIDPQKENVSKNLIPKSFKNQLTTKDVQAEDEDTQLRKGKDLDAESTTQNFMHVARQGDISPRKMEKGR